MTIWRNIKRGRYHISFYSSQSQISGYISGSNLINLTDDNGTGSIDQGVLNSVITAVSNTVDGLLSCVYAVPFNPVPTLVAEAATTFACESLMRRRLVPGEENPFTREANSFRELLKEIAQKRGGLNATTVSAFPAGIVQATWSLVNSSTA